MASTMASVPAVLANFAAAWPSTFMLDNAGIMELPLAGKNGKPSAYALQEDIRNTPFPTTLEWKIQPAAYTVARTIREESKRTHRVEGTDDRSGCRHSTSIKKHFGADLYFGFDTGDKIIMGYSLLMSGEAVFGPARDHLVQKTIDISLKFLRETGDSAFQLIVMKALLEWKAPGFTLGAAFEIRPSHVLPVRGNGSFGHTLTYAQKGKKEIAFEITSGDSAKAITERIRASQELMRKIIKENATSAPKALAFVVGKRK